MAGQAVTVADIVVHLRDEIVAARDREDRDELRKLSFVVGTLMELAEGPPAESYNDRELVIVTENLSHAITDWLVGAPLKSTIPTGDEIRVFLERRDGSWPHWAL